MNLNINDALEEIKIKGHNVFAVFLDKVSAQKNVKNQRKKNREEAEDLIENLKKARNEWAVATLNYEFAKEEELIDYYIYLIKAAQLKYNYLLKQVKERGVSWGFEDIYDIKLKQGASN